MIHFWVPGVPQPGGSKRAFVNRKTGRPIITEDNTRSKDWRTAVAFMAAEVIKEPLTGPLSVRFEFLLLRPRGHYGKRGVRSSAPEYPAVRPDVSKLVRPTEDALKGIAWHDDSQIVSQEASKRYALTAGAWITIEPAGKGEHK